MNNEIRAYMKRNGASGGSANTRRQMDARRKLVAVINKARLKSKARKLAKQARKINRRKP